jgi:hypothetical protein
MDPQPEIREVASEATRLTNVLWCAQNGSMRSRWVATVGTIALLVGLSPVSAVCVGWSTVPAARMACCAKVHGAVPAASIDACCQAGEQRTHGQSQAMVTPGVLPDTTDLGVIAPPAPLRSLRPDAVHSRTPEVATHLLLAVFLL